MNSNPKWKKRKIRPRLNFSIRPALSLIKQVSDYIQVRIIATQTSGASLTTPASRWQIFEPTFAHQDYMAANYMGNALKPWVDDHTKLTMNITNANNFPVTVGHWRLRWKKTCVADTSVFTDRTAACLFHIWTANITSAAVTDLFSDDNFDPRAMPQIYEWCDVEYTGHAIVRPGEDKVILDHNYHNVVSRSEAAVCAGIASLVANEVLCCEGEVAEIFHFMPVLVSGATSSGYPPMTVLEQLRQYTCVNVGVTQNPNGVAPIIDEPAVSGDTTAFAVTGVTTGAVVSANTTI